MCKPRAIKLKRDESRRLLKADDREFQPKTEATGSEEARQHHAVSSSDEPLYRLHLRVQLPSVVEQDKVL